MVGGFGVSKANGDYKSFIEKDDDRENWDLGFFIDKKIRKDSGYKFAIKKIMIVMVRRSKEREIFFYHYFFYIYILKKSYDLLFLFFYPFWF